MIFYFIEIMKYYKASADWFVLASGQTDKFVHVNAGLLLWLVSVWAFRRPFRSLLPLLIVIGVQSLNEAADYVVTKNWTAREMWLDMLATIAWPALLWMVMAIRSREPGARLRGLL